MVDGKMCRLLACSWTNFHTLFQLKDSTPLYHCSSPSLIHPHPSQLSSRPYSLSLLTIPPLLTLSLLYPPLTLSSSSPHSFVTLSTALFIGCLKHGFLALKSIARDPSLPFHRPALERHIRATFLHGYGDTLPAAVDELRDIDMAGVCGVVQCVCVYVCVCVGRF